MKRLAFVLIITLVLSTGAYLLVRDGRIGDSTGERGSKASAPAAKPTRAGVAGIGRQDRLAEADIDKSKVLFKSAGDASLVVLHRTLNEYYKDDRVNAIVEGKISNIEYTTVSDLIYTVVTVDVLREIKGETENKIFVYEDGGFAKFKDVIDVFRGHVDMSKLTAEQIENGLVEDKMFGAPHSETGQQVVLFLVKNPNIGSDPTRTYRVVSSVYGKLILDKQKGAYQRFELDEKDDASDNSASRIEVTPFETLVPEQDLISNLTKDN